MDKNSIDNLPQYIKAARDLSLLGGYQKSLETYKKIFQIIEARINEISNDNYLLEKWKETKEQLKKECSLILSAYQHCKTFQLDDAREEMKKKEEEKLNNNLLMRDNKKIYKSEKNINNNNSKRWEHFGGKPPFSYLKEKQEKEKENDTNISQKFNYNKPNQNYVVNNYINVNTNNNYNNYNNDNINYLNGFYEDPDVWASPEDDPRFPYQKLKKKKLMNFHQLIKVI